MTDVCSLKRMWLIEKIPFARPLRPLPANERSAGDAECGLSDSAGIHRLRSRVLARTSVCSSAVSFPRLAMAIVRLQPCFPGLQWRLLTQSTEVTARTSKLQACTSSQSQGYRL